MKKLCILIFGIFVLTGCDKEIEIDYHQVDPILVVEGGITDKGCKLRLTTTQEMHDSTAAVIVTKARVKITNLTNNQTTDLYYRWNDYQSAQAGEPGNTYQLDIWHNDRHYTAQSTMLHAPVINSFVFRWQEMMGIRVVMADLRFQDPADEENYYYMNVSRNGETYRWTVIRDILNPGGEIQQIFGCMTEKQAEEDKPEDRDNILYDGDKITVELASIDRTVYDYLYALQLSGRSSSNPVSNITGGCLGCFWAAAVARLDCVYQTSEIEDYSLEIPQR